MNTDTDYAEICRLTNGSIDTDYYLEHCHQARSLSAHRIIGLTFNYPWKLIQNTLLNRFSFTQPGIAK